MPTISVILPIYNELEYLKHCIRSIIENTRTPITVILSNDASWSETTTYCKKLISLKFPYVTFKYTENRVNAGFTYTVNQGIELHQADYYILLNTDTIIGTTNWVKKIIKVGESDSHIGLLGPVSNNANSQTITQTSEIPLSWTPKQFGYLLEQVSIRSNPPLTLINGFCYVIKHSVIADIGIFDRNKYPHYGSEDDFSMRAYERGWKAVCVDSVFVWHKRSQSYKSNKQPLKNESCRLFTRQYQHNHIRDIIIKDKQGLDPLRDKIKFLLS